ncbi:MAG: hypothetical protein H6704_00685 [Myxococcales bacterium]|nr:hypothetical protein [Myxococcales bacterium]
MSQPPEPAASDDALPAAPESFATPPPSPPSALPLVGGRDRLEVVSRGPTSALMFWELTADAVARARATLGPDQPSTLVLRVYANAPGTAAPAVTDHPVDRWLGHRIVEAPAGARLTASLGMRAEASFVHIVDGTAVRLPDPVAPIEAPADRIDLGPRPAREAAR